MYILGLLQLSIKASMASASGSACQDTNLGSCLFILEATNSNSGFPNFALIAWNTFFSSIHSVLSLNSLEAKSAFTFNLPGM